MMKIFFFFIILFFFMNKFNKFLIQMFYQNLIMLIMLYFYMKFSFNILGNWSMIYYMFSLDFYSMGLIVLSFWIMMLMIMTSNKLILSMNYLVYIYLMNFMLLMLIMCFSTMNFILFYFFFESVLIPVFLLIMGWGYQIDRIQAGMYMMLYTLIGSLPLFFMILYLFILNNTLMMNMLLMNYFNFYMYLMLIIAFLIKMPMYFVHLWLPKAHVEAPVMGSMVLAGVMLKLGSYGLMRIMLIMMELSIKFNKFIIIISLMGGLYSSLICLCQVDMKMLVAYSSVVHMSILMSGMMTLFNWGILGGFLMMIAHGLCSSGMFCLVNLNYERLLSRSLYINKGLINYFPSFSLMWFLLCSSNLSFPPSLNLFSEIMLISSLLIWNKMLMLILMLILFFSASYTLYLYSFTQHGKINLLNYSLMNLKVSEFMLLLLHWIPLNYLFNYMFIFM